MRGGLVEVSSTSTASFRPARQRSGPNLTLTLITLTLITLTRTLQVSVLATIGSLARVSGATMRPYMRELLPLLLYALRDSTTVAKRTVAVATLGMLVQSSGYVSA